MVMIGFTVDHALENIRSGKKTTTIRPKLSDKTKKQLQRCGLHLYDKPRTKNMKLIGRAEVASITDVVFKDCTLGQLAILALNDGFNNPGEMRKFFFEKYGEKYAEMEWSVIEWKNFVSGED